MSGTASATSRYSEEVAYAGQPFPHTEDGSVRVLCHQPLTAASARVRRRLCLLSLDKDDPLKLPAFAPNPGSDVRTLEASIRSYAKELKDAADVDGRKRLEAERDELSDRLLLADTIPKAEAEVARLKALKLVAACLPDTTTNLITKLGNDIADTVITAKIRDQFQSEIVSLAANKVRVEIVRSGGKYGSPQYQIRFFGNANARVHAILSEGEQTCVALSAFLTELATAAHQSRYQTLPPLRFFGQRASRLNMVCETYPMPRSTHYCL